MFNFSVKIQKTILIVFIFFLFMVWGSSFFPGSALPFISFLNLTESEPFTIKEIDNSGPRIKLQTFVTVEYSDTEKTYVFFSDEPLPFIFPKNGITKEKAEAIVKSITNEDVYGTHLVHKDGVLYWRVGVRRDPDYPHYDVNCITGEAKKSDEDNH